MREIERIDRILGLIKEIWIKCPDQRFGQMLINNGIIPDSMFAWLYEDSDLEKILKLKIKKRKQK